MKALGVPLTGRIAADRMADPGRAIARFTDLGFGPRLREVLGTDRADGPVPEDLLKAAIKVLAAWGWEERPGAVVSVGSRSRPELVRSVAEGLARVGKLPYLGSVEHTGPSSRGRSNSAQRLRAIHGTFRISNEIKAALPGSADKPICWSTTWWTADGRSPWPPTYSARPEPDLSTHSCWGLSASRESRARISIPSPE